MNAVGQPLGAHGPIPIGSENIDKPARKVACTECRQQKVRCDVVADSNQPCSRCRKFTLQCTISTPFKRTPKRNKLEELEEETHRLRRKLDQVTTPQSFDSSHGVPPALPSQPFSERAPAPTSPGDHANRESTNIHDVYDFKHPNLTGPNGEYPAERVLDGLHVDSQTIIDTYSLFYEYYAPLMPVTDPAISPDDCFNQYPFIFWMIISIGSRRYTKDATLLPSLAPRVTKYALQSLQEARGRTVQGLALLVTWPFPTESSSKDVTFTISAALVHIAMRIGLHMPRSIQDFHRTKVELNERKLIIRCEAWLRCLVAYQKASCFYGAAPAAWVAPALDPQWKEPLGKYITPSFHFQFKVQRLLCQAHLAIMENGLELTSADQKRAFKVVLKIFDQQLKDLEFENSWNDDLDRLHAVSVRLQIISLHLFRPFSEIEYQILLEMYTASSDILTLLHRCDATVHLISVCTDYIYYVIMLCGAVLLRLLKSSFAQFLDEEDGKACMMDCVNALKQISCVNNDLPARYSHILSQLWTSERAFKHEDGSSCLDLRIKSRMATSIVLDVVWWWREEFGGMPGVYSKPGSSSAPPTAPTLPTANLENWYGLDEATFMPFLEDQLWSGADWNFDPNLANLSAVPEVAPVASSTAVPDSAAPDPARAKTDHWPNVAPAAYD